MRDTIEMARESGFNVGDQFTGGTVADIKRFESLIRADERSVEREACAKVCEHTALRLGSEWMAQHCAAAIRSRGEAT
jgi:hypothetical protein